jgi:hypothetical protein
LKAEGWSSVRNFALSTKLASASGGYSTETIGRVFCARKGENKGTEIKTVMNVMRHLNYSLEEIRSMLEIYYPGGRMQWEAIGPQEIELNTFERALLEFIRKIDTLNPLVLHGLVSSMETVVIMTGLDVAAELESVKVALAHLSHGKLKVIPAKKRR